MTPHKPWAKHHEEARNGWYGSGFDTRCSYHPHDKGQKLSNGDSLSEGISSTGLQPAPSPALHLSLQAHETLEIANACCIYRYLLKSKQLDASCSSCSA